MIFKRGDTYYYKFFWRGELIRASTKQGNKNVARDIEAAKRTQLAKAEVGIEGKKPSLTLKRFCEDHIKPYAEPRTSWEWYRAGMRPLLNHAALADAPINEIRGDKVGAYVAARLAAGLSPAYINSSLRTLRRMLRLAVEWGMLDAAPKIELLQGETKRERVITPEEEKEYLKAATPLIQEVATVLFDTGMRPDELHRMRWENVRWAQARNGVICILTGKSKAARRQLPMSPRVRAVIEARWTAQGQPAGGWVWPAPTKSGHIDHSTTKKQHRATLKLSKVVPFVIYSARHTFLTRLGASGIDVWTLMRIAGHSNITQSQTYVHPDANNVNDAMEKLLGGPTVVQGGPKIRPTPKTTRKRHSGQTIEKKAI